MITTLTNITSFFSKTKNINLYLDNNKEISIKIQIKEKTTISEIIIKYINSILKLQKKLLISNIINNHKNKPVFNKYYFILKNKDDPYIQFKLNNKSNIYELLFNNPSFDLFYISTNYSNSQYFDGKLQLFIHPESKIFESNLELYANNIFTKKKFYLDNTKLLYIENDNIFHIINLSDIKKIIKGNNDIHFVKEKFIGSINEILIFNLSEDENIVLRFKSSKEREKWYNTLISLLNNIKYEQIFKSYDEKINKINKMNYEYKIHYYSRRANTKNRIVPLEYKFDNYKILKNNFNFLK